MQASLTPCRSATLPLLRAGGKLAAAPSSVVRRARTGVASDPRPGRRSGTRRARLAASELSRATLERLENTFIESLLDAHPNRDRALDRLWRDVNHARADVSPTGFPRLHLAAPECTLARLARIEALLVGAVLEGCPKRGKSLSRSLHGLAKARANAEQDPR